jgi:Putative metallopeptidase
MRRGSVVATMALAAGWLAIQPLPTMAQTATDLRNEKIVVDYYEPRDPRFQPLYERLQKRRVLEELSQFLAPVRWPKTLRMIMKECPSSGVSWPQVFYSKIEYSLTICYQWFAALRSLKSPPPAFATQQEVIVGGLVGIVLHQSAVAIFDMLSVPRLGSDDDAADQISAFVGLQFGPEVARAVIKGTYYIWKTYDDLYVDNNYQYDFAARASVPRQRMYNTLCMAYGGAPAIFKSFVDQANLLPAARAETCDEEYRQVQAAFRKTIVPRVDSDKMTTVRSMTWLSPDDLK